MIQPHDCQWPRYLARPIVVSLMLLATVRGVDAAEKLFEKPAPRPIGIVAFVEGPAWHPSGNVYFSDGGNNRIMRRDRNGMMHVYRRPSGAANGLLFDFQGRLLACEGPGPTGHRRVTRTEHDGTITVLTNSYRGKKYAGPNDLTIDSKGRIYFTDPRYGPRNGLEILDKQGRAVEGVYRIDPDGQVTQVLTHEVDRPNGIHVSADDRRLFVVDNNNNMPGVPRAVWRFDLRPDGSVVSASRKKLHDFGRGRGGDGMALDVEGRLYIAAGRTVPSPPHETTEAAGGVYVITPNGKKVGFVPIPEDQVTNCTFGGKDLKTLYITAGHTLWSIRVTTPGFVPWLNRRNKNPDRKK
ncbi:MAG: SMP-30/gluconolactonase/LRE family protein [Planctomycetaceae bacterium]